ncbi:50S ribosomal protein L11 methyltransferase [Streptomonospora litoralis]|uniref:23S rRNA (Guanine(2535)-N(1))-methyltransferase n=1 Tax=Streptomonospora litoralis TaxID=2498135 RepID=A0A4P6Q6L0_9ACTN|nr:50S ribosomal protein L11 methyltransferase [Streptomonospora litoralis]QBI56408.1 23S rRNA (guanine(2535)-N(1))-methyltransferase [Streptomonospora litoralis]
MAYRYATERRDDSDLGGGNVLYSAPGHPGFPVRLADELFQRAAARLGAAPFVLWDPCCGSGQLAVAAAMLHRDRLSRLLATDTDPAALSVAERNVGLLSGAGLAERERELRAQAAEFGKPAMVERADAAARLAERLRGLGGDLDGAVRRGDVFHPAEPERPVDLVLTDIPYGDLTRFSGAPPDADPVPALVRALAAVLPEHAVLAVTARTRKVALPAGVGALERVRAGNRAAVLVRAGDARG